MIFSTIEFAIFMTVVFLIYWSIPHRFRWIVLLAANAYFYAFYDVKYIIVLFITTVISYYFAILMEKQASFEKRRGLFIASVVIVLAFLFVFKYLNFTIYSVEKVLSLFGMPMQESTLKLILPVGISFFTFEMISYLADVYRGKIAAEKSLVKYALFVSFFANISSGPIERAGHFIPQLDKEKTFDYDNAVYGTRLLLLGLVKKIVFADMLAKYVNAVFDHVPEMTGICFLWATLLYTFQIYCDFSGYSDMALGLSRMLGFELIENFRAPYYSTSIREFWGRWHISLSAWLKDYVYIPLGGNRCSKLKRDLNLLITFLVSGIWHGASWTFILWGMIHGICQVAENRLKEAFRGIKLPKPLAGVITFCIVSFAWLFFRANSISEAYRAVRFMFADLSITNAMLRMTMSWRSVIKTLLAITAVMLYDGLTFKHDLLKEMNKLKMPLRWGIYFAAGILVLAMAANNGAAQEFIYFKF
ncbi:MAG: MBOAT family protein [Lachnospiraceae bacterium]|nr:MBOAT family protein [Lachnospiraceae bacterium]